MSQNLSSAAVVIGALSVKYGGRQATKADDIFQIHGLNG